MAKRCVVVRRRAAGAVQVTFVLVSFAYTLAGVLTLFGSGYEGLAKALTTDSLLYVFVGMGGASALIGLIGVYAYLRKSLFASKVQLVLSLVLFVVNLLMAVCLTLVATGSQTEDSALTALLTPTSEEFAKRAIDFPDFWREYQNVTNCCGVNLESLYNDNGIGVNLVRFDALLTGTRCDGERSSLLSFVSINPFTSGVLDLFATTFPLLSNGFFCGDVLTKLLEEFCGLLAGVLGMVVAVQLVALGASSAAVCAVSLDHDVVDFEKVQELNDLSKQRARVQAEGSGTPPT